MPTALKKLHDRENGFTLIELLIVVLIIGVLAAIAIPVYLGIQTQGYKSAVKADVNLTVKRVQVGVTEGKTISQIRADQTPYKQQSVKGEVVDIRASSNASAGADDFSVQGIVTKSSNPAGPVNYGYFYDSVTGKFTESEDAVALGSSLPTIAITTGSLPNGTANTAYSASINAVVTNPGGPTTYAATGLPTTLTLDAATGTIAGTPTAAGTYTVGVTATSGAVTATKTYTLNVFAKPNISTTNLPSGLTGTPYTGSIAATGNPNPSLTVTTGSLPTGVTLGTDGTFGGTPTVAGSYSFTVTASNSGGTDAKAYTIVVNTTPAVTTTTLPDATVNSAYDYTVTTTGYPSPTIAVTNLPSGLTFNPSTNKITGTPDSSAGATTQSVKIVATNTVTSDTKNIPMTVNAIAPTITTTSLPDGTVGQPYSYQLQASNASGTVTWSTPGWNGASPGSGFLFSSSGVESGTPSNFGTYSFYATATASGKSSTSLITVHFVKQWTINNAGAEDGQNTDNGMYWGAYYNPATSFSSDTAHTGSKSFKIVTNGQYPEGIIAWPYNMNLPSGTRVTVCAWISGYNGDQWNVGARTDPYNEGFFDLNVTTTGVGNWQKVCGTYNAYSNDGSSIINATGIQVHQVGGGPWASNRVLYMDDISLVVG